MFFSGLSRVYTGFVSPPAVEKHDDAIRFGLLGASAIAPIAFINPASSHPDVIVAAVAARDKARAEAYAKKHRILVVHSTYEDILQDPSIDAVYIALPNSLHYEWTLRAIRAGKHVLLEKPSCSNAEEAQALFNHPMLKSPGAPILLEAFHYRFHPAWHAFLARIHSDPEAGRVKNALIQQYLMKGVFGDDNIRWRFDLSGGTMMDFGTYAMNCLRQIFKQEPTEVLEATPRMVPGSSEAEQAMSASYRMGDGGTGSLIVDLCASPEGSLLSMLWPSRLRQMGWPRCEVELEEHTLENSEGKLHTVKRNIVFWNHLIPTIYHRIDIEDKHTIYEGEKEIKTWMESKQEKSYIWPSSKPNVGQEWWSTYRFQLEEFVNKVKGREGSGVWIDGEDSIKQMEAIDATYRKAGLKVRPTSDFQL